MALLVQTNLKFFCCCQNLFSAILRLKKRKKVSMATKFEGGGVKGISQPECYSFFDKCNNSGQVLTLNISRYELSFVDKYIS